MADLDNESGPAVTFSQCDFEDVSRAWQSQLAISGKSNARKNDFVEWPRMRGQNTAIYNVSGYPVANVSVASPGFAGGAGLHSHTAPANLQHVQLDAAPVDNGGILTLSEVIEAFTPSPSSTTAGSKDVAVTCLALVVGISERRAVMAKDGGKELGVASVMLADHTRRFLKLTLWNEKAAWVEGAGPPAPASSRWPVPRIRSGDVILLSCVGGSVYRGEVSLSAIYRSSFLVLARNGELCEAFINPAAKPMVAVPLPMLPQVRALNAAGGASQLQLLSLLAWAGREHRHLWSTVPPASTAASADGGGSDPKRRKLQARVAASDADNEVDITTPRVITSVHSLLGAEHQRQSHRDDSLHQGNDDQVDVLGVVAPGSVINVHCKIRSVSEAAGVDTSYRSGGGAAMKRVHASLVLPDSPSLPITMAVWRHTNQLASGANAAATAGSGTTSSPTAAATDDVTGHQYQTLLQLLLQAHSAGSDVVITHLLLRADLASGGRLMLNTTPATRVAAAPSPQSAASAGSLTAIEALSSRAADADTRAIDAASIGAAMELLLAGDRTAAIVRVPAIVSAVVLPHCGVGMARTVVSQCSSSGGDDGAIYAVPLSGGYCMLEPARINTMIHIVCSGCGSAVGRDRMGLYRCTGPTCYSSSSTGNNDPVWRWKPMWLRLTDQETRAGSAGRGDCGDSSLWALCDDDDVITSLLAGITAGHAAALLHSRGELPLLADNRDAGQGGHDRSLALSCGNSLLPGSLLQSATQVTAPSPSTQSGAPGTGDGRAVALVEDALQSLLVSLLSMDTPARWTLKPVPASGVTATTVDVSCPGPGALAAGAHAPAAASGAGASASAGATHRAAMSSAAESSSGSRDLPSKQLRAAVCSFSL